MHPISGDGPATSATRRRGAELEGAILDAAWEVLVEHGYPGFTYEAVAARAGTSRPVLYRRWPRREDLMRATVARYWRANPIEMPDTGTLRGDAITLMRNFHSGRAQFIPLVGVQLMEYFRESGTTLVELRDTLRPPGQPTGFEVAVARAVARGELPDAPRPARVVNLPADLIRHEMLMTLRPVPDEVVLEIVDDIWLPLLRGPA